MKSVYKKLVKFHDAVKTALEVIDPITGTEKVDLFDSVGRILSENVYAPRNNPPFNRATMDGYALRASTVRNASPDSPAVLKISGESFIGEARKTLGEEGSCFKISTGAIVPAGTDAVVKVESTLEKNGSVEIYESVGPSDNIAESGSDIAECELLLAAGKELETHDIAVLASLGISRVEVIRKLKVEVISTGNELISYDAPYSEGRINDANGVVISTELNVFQCIDARYLGIVKDDYSKIKEAIEKSLLDNDVVILSGGSSAGESDLVYRIVDELEPGMVFHGVLVKPGLPTVLGKKGNKVIIGLPGFPVSALMIFRSIFLVPLLRAAGSHRVPSKKMGRLGVNLRLEMGKQNLIPVSISTRDGIRIYPVTGLSGSITRFASTSGFLSIPGTTKFLESGSNVEVISWSNELSRSDNEFSGIFMMGLSGSSIGVKKNYDYRRMLPRDSLKSLSNGDTDLSVFLATSDLDLKSFISDELGSRSYSAFIGKKVRLVLASRTDYTQSASVLNYISSEHNIAGPSLRFLKNVVSGTDILRKTVNAIEAILTGYNATGLGEAANMAANGSADYSITTLQDADKMGLNTKIICDIYPVFVVASGNEVKIDDFVNSGDLEKLK